jgi:hypothetical protein
MKKIFLAASLAALLPLLFSCGKVKENSNNFEEPRFIQYAGQLVMRGDIAPAAAPASVPVAAPAAVSVIEYIEFSESGLYVVGIRTDGETSYKAGKFTTTDGSVYACDGFGTVELSGSNPVNVTVKRNGGATEVLKADFKKAAGSNVAYRGWTVDKTRVTVYGFSTPASADFTGCNFQEIAKFLRDNGHEPGDVPSGSLQSVSFTGAGSIIFAYSDGTANVGECTVSGASVNFSWRSTTRVFVIEGGKATIDYLDGKCILKIDAKLKNSTTSGSVTFVMSPMA